MGNAVRQRSELRSGRPVSQELNIPTIRNINVNTRGLPRVVIINLAFFCYVTIFLVCAHTEYRSIINKNCFSIRPDIANIAQLFISVRPRHET